MTLGRFLLPLVLLVVLPAAGGARQLPPSDTLAAAQSLFAAAAYEDALAMLERLKTAGGELGVGARRDLEATRALCLIGLGREREARLAMEAVVFADPQFVFDERDAAPRVRTMLEETRAKRLPQIVRERYAAARAAYYQRQYAEAAARFDAVLVLLEDPVLRQSDRDETLQDFRLLARDFQALSDQAAGATAPAGPAAADIAGAAPSGSPEPAVSETAGRGAPARATPGAVTPGAATPGPVTGSDAMPSGSAPGARPDAPRSGAVSPPAVIGTQGQGTASDRVSSPASSPAGEQARRPVSGEPAGDARTQPSSAAPAAASPPPAAAPPAAAPPGAPATPAPIVPPVAVEQPVPAWSPDLGLEPGRTYQATVEVVIDEAGRVTSARMIDSINATYDASLLEAVRRWRYRPGTRGGVPVRFAKLVTVTVEAQE